MLKSLSSQILKSQQKAGQKTGQRHFSDRINHTSINQAEALRFRPVPGMQTWYTTEKSPSNTKQYVSQLSFQNLKSGQTGQITLDESFPSMSGVRVISIEGNEIILEDFLEENSQFVGSSTMPRSSSSPSTSTPAFKNELRNIINQLRDAKIVDHVNAED